ncbi:MAG: hypothetical protein ACRDGE_04080 [Candidatus Limnocylindria bacterium]
MRAFPAYFCAAANLAAILALATILAPGTTLIEEPARAAYVRENAGLWRAGWSLWVIAAVSLLVFYRWWAGRIGASVAPVAVAAAGFAVDLVAESLLIAVVPDRPDLARLSFVLTGGPANGLYTLAGALLSLRTPGMSGTFAIWSWAIWTLGAILSVVSVVEAPRAIAVAGAALFALFLPWCVAMGRRLG